MTGSGIRLETFLPDLLIEDLTTRGTLPSGPTGREMPAAILFADLTNFTATTEELAQRGPEGAELVADYIEQVFTPLLRTVSEYGGDVLSSAGDSITVMWAAREENLGEAVAAAVTCGAEMERRVAGMASTGSRPVFLTVAIGAGPGSLLQLGGDGDRWKYLYAGTAIEQIERTHPNAGPGEVILSDEAAVLAGPLIQITQRANGDNLVVSLEAIPVVPKTRPSIGRELTSLLQSYVPEPVLKGSDRGELRMITAMFVKLLGLDVTVDRDRDALNGAVTAIQRVLGLYSGTFLQLAAGDKGLTAVAAFGLPPNAYEEDAARATQAALEVERELRELRIEYGVGIASGSAYCGTYGTQFHTEYAVVGSAMNRAARLMEASRNAITTDEATMKATGGRIRFSEQPPVRAKGIEALLPAFRPLWEEDLTQRSLAFLAEHSRSGVVGRKSERESLTAFLNRLENGDSSAVVLEGEPGIGKSILLADLVATARERGVTALFGTGDTVERNTPYHAWKPVFEQLFDLAQVVDMGARQERVLERLRRRPEVVQFAPLLQALTNVRFPENEATRSLAMGRRRDGILDLAITLFKDEAGSSPILLALDDAHWMDSASWELLRRVRRNVRPLLLVLAAWSGERPAELDELLSETDTVRIPIGRMPPDESIELVRNRLGAEELPDRIASLINEKAEGHPFITEEIASTLQEANAIEIEDGKAKLLVDNQALEAIQVPDTVRGLITSRLSRLPSAESRTLRVASVLGTHFHPDVLRAIHPGHPDPEEMADQLRHLERLGLVSIETDGSVAFQHSLIHSVAYDMTEGRRAIHATAADWFETNRENEMWVYPLIAHHWEEAEQPARALPFLERAGASALDQGASSEAEHFFQRVIDAGVDQDVEVGRAAHWATQLGQARAEMGNLAGAEEAYYEALNLLDVPMPRSTPARLARLLWESLVQIGHLMSLGRTIKDEARALHTAQAARICSLIGELYYFTADQIGFPLLNLVSINRAERSGRVEAAGLGYSSFSYLVGTLRLERLAARYNAKALFGETTESPPDQDIGEGWIVPLGPAHKVAAANSRASYLMGNSRWAEALESLREGIESARKLRDFYTLEISLTLRAVAHLSVSPLEEAASDLAEVLESARDRSNVQHEAWALSLQAMVHLRRGDPRAAMSASDEAAPLVSDETETAESIDPTTVPMFCAARAAAHLRLGEARDALINLERSLDALALAPVFANLPAYQAVLATLQDAHGVPGVEPANLQILERRAGKLMRRFALLFPFAEPTYALWKGRSKLGRGAKRRARSLLSKGLDYAIEAGQVWDEAILRGWTAMTFEPGDPERHAHLRAARESFDRLGGVFQFAELNGTVSD